jgi:ABC-type multidrug transport system fused ATPase/permease subunit
MRLPPLFRGRRRGLFLLLLGNGLLQGLLAVASALVVMQLFDRLGLGGPPPWALFAALAGAVALAALLRRAERVHAEGLGQHYVRSVRDRLYGRLLRSNPRDLKRRRKGGLLLKFVGDLGALRRWISLGLARLLVAGISLTLALGALAWMYWPFALAVASMLVLSTLLILRQSRPLRAAIAETRRYQAHMSANVTDKLGHLAAVQGFRREQREQRLLRRQSNRLLRASVAKAAQIGNLRALVDLASGGSVLLVLMLAYLLVPQGLSAGMLAAAITIIGFLTPPLRDLGRVQEYWLAAQVARENLQAIAGRRSRLRQRRDAAALVVADGEVRLEGVRLGRLLRDVDATVPGGSRVALFGANGSGKSTLLGLIARHLDPQRGRVLIDGQRLRDVTLDSVRRQIAYVGNDMPLVRGSLRKNLCYGAGDVGPAELSRVLEACRLDDLLARLPGGLQARLSEDGSNLSQGERVRVTLARALLARPKLLLLDEVEANLDAPSQLALDRVVREFPGTVIMASHRAATRGLCDQVWELRDGRLHASIATPGGQDAPTQQAVDRSAPGVRLVSPQGKTR